jgi:hypothetical protein
VGPFNLGTNLGSLNFEKAKPVPGIPAENRPGNLTERLFKLRFIRFREMETTLLLFRAEVDITSAVIRAKEWCSKENVRFIHLDRAIQEIE